MSASRRIVVHCLADAEAALCAAAELDVPVTLESPPAAAAYLGAAFFLAMLRQASAAHPAARFDAVLDCGDAPGHALAALRAGVKAVRLEASAEAIRRLRGIAAQLSATVETEAPEALDLASVPQGLRAQACRDWLSRQL